MLYEVITVLLRESIEGLNIKQDGIYAGAYQPNLVRHIGSPNNRRYP